MVTFLSAAQAAGLVRDGQRVGISGFGGWSAPDDILRGIADRYALTGSPGNLTVYAGVVPGDMTEDGYGLSTLGAEGLVTTLVAGQTGQAPRIFRALGENRIAGYCLPLGVVGHLFEAMAGKKPGVLTHVGLHTFCDPRLDGCRMNDAARAQGRELVSLMEVDGREYLFYHALAPMDVCIIHATYADEDGNISFDELPFISEQPEMAHACHNNGGIVIVQVKEIVQRGSIPPRSVLIHSSCVDYVVKADPANHPQGYMDSDRLRLELTGAIKLPLSALPPMKLNVRKVIGRRAAMELRENALVNLGIGLPDGVAAVANEEGISDRITLAVETGTFGGVPVGSVGMGAAVNPEALYRITDNFDLYDGGCLDMTCLGMAEADQEGNVNVSKFAGRVVGPGGFINISQNTPKVCFLASFTAGKSDIEVSEGALHIRSDASGVKFRRHVEQVTFSARYARQTGQEVFYITERAVFQLTEWGLTLVEIAPGVDLSRDILAHMEFRPAVSEQLKLMDERIFRAEKMGLVF